MSHRLKYKNAALFFTFCSYKDKQVSLHLCDPECLFAWLPCFVFSCDVRPIIFYRIKNKFVLKCHHFLNMKVLYSFFLIQHVFFNANISFYMSALLPHCNNNNFQYFPDRVVLFMFF